MKVEVLSVTPAAEKIVEEAGRTCYRSESKINGGSKQGFIKRLIAAGHFSVLEHASVTIRLSGISRALTHQLVRHRLCSFSQQSQRYVKEEKFDYNTPPSIGSDKDALNIYNDCMEYLSGVYSKLLSIGILKEDARYVLPNACATQIVFTANFRQLRRMISLRGEKKAQWEIREVFIKILEQMKNIAPNCFFDLETDYKKRTVSSAVSDRE